MSLRFGVLAAEPSESASPPAVKPFVLRDLDAPPPRLLTPAKPLYPLLAKQRGLEGHVDIEFLIGPDGTVSGVTVLHSEPTELFDESARKTAQRWRFSAPKRDGKAVSVLARQRIQFTLEKS